MTVLPNLSVQTSSLLPAQTGAAKSFVPSAFMQGGSQGDSVQFSGHFSFSSGPSGQKKPGLLTRAKVAIAAGVLALGGGGATALANTPPENTVATARAATMGLQNPWPAAYMQDDGTVIAPLLRAQKGHVDEDGKVRGLAGQAKGQGAEDGKIYENILPFDRAKRPLPSAVMDEEGTVRSWPVGVLPIGYIHADEDVSTGQKAGLGVWLIPSEPASRSD